MLPTLPTIARTLVATCALVVALSTSAQAAAPCPDGARCGTVTVPLDRSQPAAGTIDVAYALLPRTDTSRPALSAIVPNPGGPGSGPIAEAADWAERLAPLRKRRDILLIDPRGTGQSGTLACPSLASQNLLTLDLAGIATVCGADLARTREPLRRGRRRRRLRGRPCLARHREGRPVGAVLRHLPDAGLRGSPSRARPVDRPQRRVSDRVRHVGPRPAARRAAIDRAGLPACRYVLGPRSARAASGGS